MTDYVQMIPCSTELPDMMALLSYYWYVGRKTKTMPKVVK